MSNERQPTPPSSGSGASTPPTNPTQPCPDCNCCVTSVVIENVTPFNNGSQAGHSYDFRINMTYSGGTSGTSNCVLEWWERTNVTYLPNQQANTWMELYAFYPQSPTFSPWTNRSIPCPGGGSSTVVINDPPALGIRPGRTVTRTLDFRLKVKSGSSCPCSVTSATATATQVLVMVNGVLDNSASSFTIGPSSTTP